MRYIKWVGWLVLTPILLAIGLLILLGALMLAATPLILPLMVVGAMIVVGIHTLHEQRTARKNISNIQRLQ